MAIIALQRFFPPPRLALARIVAERNGVAIPGPTPPETLFALIGPPGPVGAAGGPGPAGQPLRIDFTSAATWIAEHGLGRAPAVQVFLPGGEWIVADVSSTAINVTITHAQPHAGFILLI